MLAYRSLTTGHVSTHDSVHHRINAIDDRTQRTPVDSDVSRLENLTWSTWNDCEHHANPLERSDCWADLNPRDKVQTTRTLRRQTKGKANDRFRAVGRHVDNRHGDWIRVERLIQMNRLKCLGECLQRGQQSTGKTQWPSSSEFSQLTWRDFDWDVGLLSSHWSMTTREVCQRSNRHEKGSTDEQSVTRSRLIATYFVGQIRQTNAIDDVHSRSDIRRRVKRDGFSIQIRQHIRNIVRIVDR